MVLEPAHVSGDRPAGAFVRRLQLWRSERKQEVETHAVRKLAFRDDGTAGVGLCVDGQKSFERSQSRQSRAVTFELADAEDRLQRGLEVGTVRGQS